VYPEPDTDTHDRFHDDVPPLLSAAGIFPRLPVDAPLSDDMSLYQYCIGFGVRICAADFPYNKESRVGTPQEIPTRES
jgi:hypothetical protein